MKKRKELFEARKSAVETEIQRLQKTLSLLKFKCWYYETAMKDGNEDAINATLPDKLPENFNCQSHFRPVFHHRYNFSEVIADNKSAGLSKK